MKKILKKIGLGLIGVLMLSNVAFAQMGGGVSYPNYFKKVGDALLPVISTLELGSTTTRWAKGWFTAIDATTAVLGGITSGTVTIDVDDAEALLVRKDGDLGDVFIVDTVASHIEVDTIAELTGANGVTIDGMNIANDLTTTTFLGTTGDYNQIGDAAATSSSLNSEDDLQVTGELEVDGTTFLDGLTVGNNTLRMNDEKSFYFGASNDSIMRWGTTTQTNDSLQLGLGATSGTMIVSDVTDVNTDFGHANQSNPTIFVQSADEATVADYAKIYHDQTNAHIDSGAGFVVADGAGGVSLRHNGTTSMTFTTDGTVATMIGQAGDYARFGDAGTTGHSLATNDDVLFTGQTEFDGTASFDGSIIAYSALNMRDNVALSFGNSGNTDTQLQHNTAQTPDSFMVGVGDNSNAVVLTLEANLNYDHAHALQTNPTLYGQSANQSATEWWSLTHNQTNVVADAGAGLWSFVDGVLIDDDADTVALDIDSEATSAGNYGFNVNTGQGASAFRARYGTDANGRAILAQNPNSAGTGSFFFNRNLAAASTARPMMYFHQENAGDDQDLAVFVQAGSGAAITVNPGRIVEYQGTDVASASTIAPLNGNVFELTGTTDVDLITTTGWQEGGRLTLICNESVTINHGTATSGSNVTILLASASNFSCTANDTLTLVLSSTTAGGQAWRETTRTAI